MLAIKQRPQNPVLISRYLACRLKIPSTWLVICVIEDSKATRRTSGEVLTLLITIDLVRAIAFPSPEAGASAEVVLVKRFQPSWLLMAASASANARDCSNSVIPVSGATGRPCTAQETVSRNWLRQNVPNKGHNRDKEPVRLRAEPDSSDGIIRTAMQECSSEAEKSKIELRELRKAFRCENIKSELLLALPHRSSEKSDEVWH
jgi:hypothetical protein|uniref:Uncharacterized protein n=1 Tax=Fusarium oxysporum (strain Fo5176) TaxID=660025 RepID=A0A0D2Y4Z4_FUSOF